MGRYYQNLDYPHFDYKIEPLGPSPAREVRGPLPDFRHPYFVCIGAAQTFGRFCNRPFANILSEALDLPVLNLGLGGSGPRAFLDDFLLGLINASEFVVVQVLSGSKESNSAFDNSQSGGTHGIRLRDMKRMRFEEFIKEEVKTSSRSRIAELVAETRQNWVQRYEQLLARISVPKVLHWFSAGSPDRIDDYSAGMALLGHFPHLVNRRMIEEVRFSCDAYVETVGHKGLPQPLWKSDHPLDGPELREGMLFNNYYPSPEMHEAAGRDLLQICRRLVAKRLRDGDRVEELVLLSERPMEFDRCRQILTQGGVEFAESARGGLISAKSRGGKKKDLLFTPVTYDELFGDQSVQNRIRSDRPAIIHMIRRNWIDGYLHERTDRSPEKRPAPADASLGPVEFMKGIVQARTRAERIRRDFADQEMLEVYLEDLARNGENVANRILRFLGRRPENSADGPASLSDTSKCDVLKNRDQLRGILLHAARSLDGKG